MSTTLESPPTREEFVEIQTRLRALEDELEELRRKHGAHAPNWRASMRRMQEGWASMPPELREEFSAILDQGIAEARAARVDDEE
jgi:hypothetical protein